MTVLLRGATLIDGTGGDPLAEPELFDGPERVVLVIEDGRVVKDTRR